MMNKIVLTLTAIASLTMANYSAKAHLGWTLQECENAWGSPVKVTQASSAPAYLFRAQPNLYVEVALINSKVESLVYFSRNSRFLMNHIDAFLQRNCEGVWNLYDDYRGKQTAKSWHVLDTEGNVVAYALLWNYPEARGYYRLQVSSFVWESFLTNNGENNNNAPITNVGELNI